jgi:hypothetical protein
MADLVAQGNDLHSRDWMRELAADAQKVQAVITGIDVTTARAHIALRLGDYRQVAIRLEEIREGLRLVCELTGIKIQA